LINTAGILSVSRHLIKMRHKHAIDIACIEEYQNFGKRFRNAAKVQQQIRACQDVFPNKIMIKTGQWNPRHFKDNYKRMLAASAFHRVFTNSHTTDAAMMGNWFASWITSWARFCDIKPDEMARIIAQKFGRIPKRGELQIWFETLKKTSTGVYFAFKQPVKRFSDGKNERRSKCNSMK